ncbi:hypothetical protein [Microbulbifer sp. VAAF005]|uniref:hypothetical protein n=1 Tax=Microbulbifer sp. VAAF005 TaxID=3034230 RepID=UPI0024ACFB81|nr:hypothetical protein [Microbulbifer sp. VAAF005]WHI46921.1 hypothetical protein P0078_00685 [Microbulbifer sp. VAAF005]
MQGISEAGNAITFGLGTGVSKAADNWLIPKTQGKIKLEISNDIKGKKAPGYISIYRKLNHLYKGDREGEGTLLAFEERCNQTYYSLVHCLLNREEMDIETKQEVIDHYFLKLNSSFPLVDQ